MVGDRFHRAGGVPAVLHELLLAGKVDGTVLTANENFLRLMGYSLDEVRGRHHRVFC